MKFVKPDVLNSASLSVGEDHGPTDKLRASLLERAENRRSLEFSFHGCSLGELEKRSSAANSSDGATPIGSVLGYGHSTLLFLTLGPKEREPDDANDQYRKAPTGRTPLGVLRWVFMIIPCFLIGITRSLKFSALRQPGQTPGRFQHHRGRLQKVYLRRRVVTSRWWHRVHRRFHWPRSRVVRSCWNLLASFGWFGVAIVLWHLGLPK